MRAEQIGDGQVGAAEIGVVHRGEAEISLTQASAGDVYPRQIAIAQIRLKQIAARAGLTGLNAGDFTGVLGESRTCKAQYQAQKSQNLFQHGAHLVCYRAILRKFQALELDLARPSTGVAPQKSRVFDHGEVAAFRAGVAMIVDHVLFQTLHIGAA